MLESTINESPPTVIVACGLRVNELGIKTIVIEAAKQLYERKQRLIAR